MKNKGARATQTPKLCFYNDDGNWVHNPVPLMRTMTDSNLLQPLEHPDRLEPQVHPRTPEVWVGRTLTTRICPRSPPYIIREACLGASERLLTSRPQKPPGPAGALRGYRPLPLSSQRGERGAAPSLPTMSTSSGTARAAYLHRHAALRPALDASKMKRMGHSVLS